MVRREKEQSKRKSVTGQVIALVVTLLLAGTEFWEFMIVLLAIALVISPVAIPLVIYFRRKKHKETHQRSLQDTTFTSCDKQRAFDERVQDLFCFHDDKAIHRVSRGREIDPWDRPDIDISKYQRKE